MIDATYLIQLVDKADRKTAWEFLQHMLDAVPYHVHSLKTLGRLTPYQYICKIWTSEPDRFILNPIHQMLGLNT